MEPIQYASATTAGAGIVRIFFNARTRYTADTRISACRKRCEYHERVARFRPLAEGSSPTARCASSIATSVYAPMPASELAMAMRPKRLRPMTFGMRSGGVSPSTRLLYRACFVQRFGIDAERMHQVRRDFAVRPRAFDEQRAAVQQVHAAVHMKLVALGVAAEVVVVVEDQHSTAGRARPEVMRGCQAADAGADDDEVEGFARVVDWTCQRTRVAQRMRCFEGAGVTAAHAQTRRRVVTTPIAAPCRKSRRAIGRSMPRSWSLRVAMCGLLPIFPESAHSRNE